MNAQSGTIKTEIKRLVGLAAQLKLPHGALDSIVTHLHTIEEATDKKGTNIFPAAVRINKSGLYAQIKFLLYEGGDVEEAIREASS